MKSGGIGWGCGAEEGGGAAGEEGITEGGEGECVEVDAGGGGADGHLAVGELAAGFVGQLDDQLEVGREIDGAGAPMTVHGFRDDRLTTYALVPDAAPQDTCWLELRGDGAAPSAPGLDWLGGVRG